MLDCSSARQLTQPVRERIQQRPAPDRTRSATGGNHAKNVPTLAEHRSDCPQAMACTTSINNAVGRFDVRIDGLVIECGHTSPASSRSHQRNAVRV